MVQIPAFTSIALLDPPGGRQGRNAQPFHRWRNKGFEVAQAGGGGAGPRTQISHVRPELCCNLGPGDCGLHREGLGSHGPQQPGSSLGVDGELHRAAHSQGQVRTPTGSRLWVTMAKLPLLCGPDEVCMRLGGSIREALGLSGGTT